jgi:hypothetical protein
MPSDMWTTISSMNSSMPTDAMSAASGMADRRVAEAAEIDDIADHSRATADTAKTSTGGQLRPRKAATPT